MEKKKISDDYTFDFENDHIEILNQHTTPIYTYGGSTWIDDIFVDEWGIDFGHFSVSGFGYQSMTELALSVTNHLLVSGVDFEFYSDENGKHIKLKP
jgi:hypothetical protein